MNNRTFVGDIQVSDLAPENRTFVQTQEATTVFRHLYKHRRRHYNVTVTWRHYYIRPVFPRHDKWQETDDDRYLYSPSSDILMGAIFSSAATSDASRLPLQNIGGLKRWTMEYNLNNKRSGDKSGTGNSGKTIVHTTPLCITLDNQDQVLFETNQDTWKSQSTKLFYSTTKNREMTDRLSRNLKLLKNYSMIWSSDWKVQAKVEPTCPSRNPLHCWTARWGCRRTLGWCRGTTSESGSHRILGENICRRKIFEE